MALNSAFLIFRQGTTIFLPKKLAEVVSHPIIVHCSYAFFMNGGLAVGRLSVCGGLAVGRLT